ADVKEALIAQNVELTSGKLTGQNTELTVKTIGNLDTEEEFNDIIILAKNGTVVRLSDVGKASLEGENMETKMSDSGQPMVAIAIVPQPGTNYLDIADEFYQEFEQLKKDLPQGYTLNVVIDDTAFVRKAVSEVVETLMISIVLVILVIFIFFRNWSMALRPLIDIPVSLIATRSEEHTSELQSRENLVC